MLSTLLEFTLVLGAVAGLAVLMGKWLTRVFTGTHHALPERYTYRLLASTHRKPWAGPASVRRCCCRTRQ